MNLFIGGDPFSAAENAIIVANHRTRLDWNFIWAALLHSGVPTSAHNTKLILKDDVKEVPGVGWTMQMSRFFYISRKWKKDEIRLERMISHLTSSSDPFQLLLFPEGTNLTKDTKVTSDKFAAANNLEPYSHVLHPRTTGFSFLAKRMIEGPFAFIILLMIVLIGTRISRAEIRRRVRSDHGLSGSSAG